MKVCQLYLLQRIVALASMATADTAITEAGPTVATIFVRARLLGTGFDVFAKFTYD